MKHFSIASSFKMYLTFAILSCCVCFIDAAKVIISGVQFESHIIAHTTIGEELVHRGHEVYLVTASRYPKRKRVEEMGMKLLQYHIPNDVLYGVSDEFYLILADMIFNRTDEDINALSFNLASGLVYRDCTYMMEDEDFLEKVRKLNVDLVIAEAFITAPCNLILPQYLNLTFVSMAAFYHPWQIGIPALPSFFPLPTKWYDSRYNTLLAKLKNTFNYVTFGGLLNVYLPENTTLLKRYAPEFESWNELNRKSELFLVEGDHHLGMPIPALPNYISVAGHTSCRLKPLPEELEKTMNDSKDGVILFSFGSVANYLPREVIVKLFAVFSKLNQTVLVKLFVPDDINVPTNVKIFSWLPQNDILGHPLTKLFITHCGNNGQHEALYNAVPMIGFPLFAEQHVNCHRAFVKGYGLQMNIHDFTSEELYNNIQEVLNNPKYRSTIRKDSETFRDQPMKPNERGAFWIEHVMKHGGKHLRSPAMDMAMYEFLALDIVLLLLVAVFGFLFFIILLFRIFYIRCCSSKQLKTMKPKSQ